MHSNENANIELRANDREWEIVGCVCVLSRYWAAYVLRNSMKFELLFILTRFARSIECTIEKRCQKCFFFRCRKSKHDKNYKLPSIFVLYPFDKKTTNAKRIKYSPFGPNLTFTVSVCVWHSVAKYIKYQNWKWEMSNFDSFDIFLNSSFLPTIYFILQWYSIYLRTKWTEKFTNLKRFVRNY